MDKKRVIVSFVICCLSIGFAVAQNEVIDDGSRGYLERGKLLYQDKSYVACIDQMTEARALTRDEAVREEADYLIAMSHYHRGSRITPDLLQKFLNDYPRSSHVLSVRYTMGNYYFFDTHKRYPETHFQEAIKYYKELDITQLNGNDRTDFCFRLAFSFFKTGEPNRARPLFEVLKRESKTYRDAASFYLAYLDYTDGKYDDAIRQFTELKDAPRFGTPSRFYIAQIRFLRKEYQAVWDVGTELLQKKSVVAFPLRTLPPARRERIPSGHEERGGTLSYLLYRQYGKTVAEQPVYHGGIELRSGPLFECGIVPYPGGGRGRRFDAKRISLSRTCLSETER